MIQLALKRHPDFAPEVQKIIVETKGRLIVEFLMEVQYKFSKALRDPEDEDQWDGSVS
jgi:hypothetical protein